jgi:hypothetical protein
MARSVAAWVLRVLTAAGLAVDAYVHADLAGQYDPIRHSISEGALFRIEAGAAALAALLILISAGRLVWALAFAVAAGGLFALVLYRYVNVGQFGPLPNMYEPIWYTEKSNAAIAEAAAVATALAGFILAMVRAASLRRRP